MISSPESRLKTALLSSNTPNKYSFRFNLAVQLLKDPGGRRGGEDEILVSKTDLLEGHWNKMETAEKESNLGGI